MSKYEERLDQAKEHVAAGGELEINALAELWELNPDAVRTKALFKKISDELSGEGEEDLDGDTPQEPVEAPTPKAKAKAKPIYFQGSDNVMREVVLIAETADRVIYGEKKDEIRRVDIGGTKVDVNFTTLEVSDPDRAKKLRALL